MQRWRGRGQVPTELMADGSTCVGEGSGGQLHD